MIKLIVLGIIFLFFLIGIIFSLKSYKNMISVYNLYDSEFVYCGLTGYQFAVFAIQRLGLKTRIGQVEKDLEDCYIPSKDVIFLSKRTINSSSVSSICITAHELGHAVQNKKQSGLFVLQQCLNVLGKVSLALFPILLVTGLVLLFVPDKFDLGLVLLIISFAMQVIVMLLKIFTIPMEMEASKIAYNFLKENGVLVDDELKHGKKVLNSAIGTYVASLFMPIIKFFRFLNRIFRS